MSDDIYGQGLAFPAKITPLGTLALSSGSDRLLDAAENIICTPLGTCPLDPKFGLDLDAYDAIHDIAELAWAITRAVEYGEPRALKIKAIIEKIDISNGFSEIRLEITPRDGSTPQTRTFPFYRKI